jgi:radical SAM/Cys-rich protein
MNLDEQHELLMHLDRPKSFIDQLRECAAYPLKAQSIDTLQMNITRRCNLCCRHCHVEGSPHRGEEMSKENMKACLHAAIHSGIATLDITGGAPEMHPHFEWFLRAAGRSVQRIMVRSNVAILCDNSCHRYIDVYSDIGVEVIASLPSLLRERTDRMRGKGVFNLIIEGLRALNARGYGIPDSGLILDLVHNPVGAFLPGSQDAMESEYRFRLRRDFGIEFNRLFCLTNCPVGRYLDFLKCSGNLIEYMNSLKMAFNPAAVGKVMCRSMLSVGCDGRLFDCDFNQVLDMPISANAASNIRNFDFNKLAQREIVVRSHCFSCTAGTGSSCQGSLDN